MSTTLLIGFDSAWAGNNSGAIVGALKQGNDSYTSLGDPQPANFEQATNQIKGWQEEHCPTKTLILIDQPTIVQNMAGQRPVENIVGSPVSRRYGGVQPANRNKIEMFGDDAPIWNFLTAHKATLNPATFNQSQSGTWVIETYPVLSLIAMDWLITDDHPNLRPTGRLPKYNPTKRNFSPDDWQYVCNQAANAFKPTGIMDLVTWIEAAKNNPLPAARAARKQLQDCLDACLCLLVALHLIEGRNCLFIGEMGTGYMVVPYGQVLDEELIARCENTARPPANWIFQIQG